MTEPNAGASDKTAQCHAETGSETEPSTDKLDNFTVSMPSKIEFGAEFNTFLELRDAIEVYQKQNSVQLIVKDSKLLKAESTRKVIPKVYHLVNQKLMYHSITYCCKCHGELKQKLGTRVKNVGAKRLNCPMYFRLKLTPDLQKLVLFDIDETHNHGIDPTTCQMPPRQQVYKLSRLRRAQQASDDEMEGETETDVGSLIATAIRDVNAVRDATFEPARKIARVKLETDDGNLASTDVNNGSAKHSDSHDNGDFHGRESPLDSEFSNSDSDEDELRTQRHLIPFPMRLMGSAIQSSPELIAASRQVIELQRSLLLLKKHKLTLQTRNLELENYKLELEVRLIEKGLSAETAAPNHEQDTTIYLQTS